jgi:hypothetical protein
MAQSV